MTENALHIRHAKPEDIGDIETIYANARRYMAENGNPNQWVNGYPDIVQVREDLDNGNLYVCVGSDDTIVGVFCYFQGVEPDYLKIYQGSWLADGPYGVIHRIAVGAHQKGVASACIAYAFSRCGNLRIDTHRDNLPMQRTLARNGFTPCGIIYTKYGGERIAFQKTQKGNG